ncbi:PadR family transcriptional regulator [Pseudonocardia sp. RS010]|uniref:PadR family transcriptional regulator n=1 Tax=Pseudonocardia sp. RS010 TaxID=3385979 RepID=UPI0039A0CF04
MTAMNPSWDAPFGPRFGGRRGRWHPRPPFGPGARSAVGPAGPDTTVNIDADPAGEGRDRLRGRRGGRVGPGGPFGPGFGPGAPFGPGFGPFGRGGPGPRGRRGRRTSRGDVRLAVLALVAEQPRHGYEIIQEIGERSGGRWRPSPGSVYPTLNQLEDEGLVRVEQAEGRRVVHLTEEGTRYVEAHREELEKVWAAFAGDGDDGPESVLWEQLGQLHAAAQQVLAAGTPDQIEQATAALTEARKTIYRLLAE